MKKTLARSSLLLFCTMLLSGCFTVSHTTFQGTANGYNIALQRTNDEQLLLNIVRLRYRDTPFFMEASALTSQFDLSTSAGISGAFPLSGNAPDVLNGNTGISFSERPTISYTPLQGEEFLERMLEQISLDKIVLLANSGWSLDTVTRMVVQRTNGVENAAGASGPTPNVPPTQYVEFKEISSRLFQLQREGLLQIGEADRNGTATPSVILPASGTSQAADEVRKRINLDPDLEQYWVEQGIAFHVRENTDTITLNTRSLLGVLYFLSQSVEVPEDHKEQGLVTVTRDAEGREFSWQRPLENIFQVHTSQKAPKDATIATRYRGAWFYIKDSDLMSKQNFVLLNQMFALQTGDTVSQTPLLTIPVSN